MQCSLSPVERLAVRPARLLTQNACVARDGIFNWCLPAWKGRLADGRAYDTCPSAGICAKVCYARAGTYQFSNVRQRHQRNLAYLLDDLPGWTTQMIDEIGRKYVALLRRKARKRPKQVRIPETVIVRIHDAGDFFSDEYLLAWLDVMAAHPECRFYTYTKEVDRFREFIEPCPPPNFAWVYSYGGTQDGLLDPDRDRVCDVFPTVAALQAAGYHDQSESDLLAVDGPAPVGIPANRIRHFLKRQGDRTFRTWQEQADARAAVLAARRGASTPRPASRSQEPDPWGPLLDRLLPAS